MEDHEIIDLYWERSENAISATSEKYGSYCSAISFNILHNQQDVEECVNDTYMAAWNAMPPHRPNRLAVFLGRITRNLSLNRVKRDATAKRGLGQTVLVLSELEECISASGTVEQAMDEKLLLKAIEQFLYTQPNEKRNIFIRRYWYLTPVKEIAAGYGLSESKVKSLLHRMRNKLRIHLEKEGIYL